MAPHDTNAGRPRQTMKVLAIGLPRAGSSSMTEALRILGYPEVYHLGKIPWTSSDHAQLIRACNATFPSLPSYSRDNAPFTRADWDEIFGTWEGVADAGGVFAPQLAAAYPEAKVVLIHRPFDKWAKSFLDLVDLFSSPLAYLSYYVSDPILGICRTESIRKMAMGFVGARTWAEVRDMDKLRARYDRHYDDIRAIVPADRLFEMELGDGWEGLCAFLDKPVPDVPFPKKNQAAELKQGLPQEQWVKAKEAIFKLVVPLAACGAVAGGVWMASTGRGWKLS